MAQRKKHRFRMTSKPQYVMMVSVMEEYPIVAMGLKYIEGNRLRREQYNDVWEKLTKRLNNIGPPFRGVQEWQKVWNDLKLKIRRRLFFDTEEDNNIDINQRAMTLKAHELAVMNLLGWNNFEDHQDTSVDASPSTSVPDSSSVEKPENETLISDIVVKVEMEDNGQYSAESQVTEDSPAMQASSTKNYASAERPTEFPSERPTKSSRKTYKTLTAHHYRQKALLERHNELLGMLVVNSNQQVQYMRKSLELQKQKFEFKRKHLETMEKIRKDELQLRIQMLECRKMELQRTATGE